MNREERRRAARGRGGPHAASPAPLDSLLDQAANHAKAGRMDEAEAAARAAVAADKRDAAACIVLAAILRLQGRLDEATAQARRAVAREPRSGRALAELGECLRAQDRVIEALESLQRAVDLAPDEPMVQHAYGMALSDVGDIPRATQHLRRAAELAPSLPLYLNGHATGLVHLGQFDEALRILDAILQVDPTITSVQFNRSFCLFGLGRIGEGWDAYDRGFGGPRPGRDLALPRWRGEPMAAPETLLIWREQGVGDEIRFASCYAEALDRVERAVVETDPRLVSLMARSFPSATIVPSVPPIEIGPDVTAAVPSGAVAGLFRRRLEDFPSDNTYLVASDAHREDFRRRLGDLGGTPRVGVCWRSMRLDVSRLAWYTTLDEWAPVLALPDITFVNLQYGRRDHVESELAAAEERSGRTIVRWDDVDYTDDFESVAALICELDLVVSVNTAVSALAGALGKPVLQLGVVGDPFQMGQPDRYVWFPSMRQLSRRWDEGWGPTMHQVADAVAEHVRRLA